MNPMEIEELPDWELEFWPSLIVDIDIDLGTDDSKMDIGPDYLADRDAYSDSDTEDFIDRDYSPYYISSKYNGIRVQHTNSPSTSMEVKTSLSDRDDRDEDDSMEWLPTSNTSTSLLTPKSPQYKYTTWLPGSMAKLPLELVYDIFDRILFENTSRLSHDRLHGLMSFREASKHTREMVDCYLRRDSISTYLRSQLVDWKSPDCVKWYRSRVEAFSASRAKTRATGANPAPDCDLLTEIIVDDCPYCYKWLGQKIPGFSQTAFAFNEYGWRFVAIAIRSGSYKILKHLVNLKNCEPPVRLLTDFADACGFSETTCLGMLAYQKDPIFAEKVLDLIGPLVLRDQSKGWIAKAFNRREKVRLCKYITVRTAEWLTLLGVRLWRVGTLGLRPRLRGGFGGSRAVMSSEPTKVNNVAWNAAIHNTPEFLEFLYKHDPEGVSRTVDNLRPIHFAVWANRVDTFKWLLRKMNKLDDIKNPPNGGIFFNSTNRIDVAIARHASPESEIMLKQILAGPSADGHNYQITGQFFKDIVLGTKEAVLNLAVRSDLDQDSLDKLRLEHEQRAIRKAKAVSKVYFDTGFHSMPVLTKADANARHADAINLAKTLGFGELENVFDSYGAI